MLESSCSGNAQKPNLLQSSAEIHWATSGSLLEKYKENNLATVSFLKLLTMKNLFACFHYLVTYQKWTLTLMI